MKLTKRQKKRLIQLVISLVFIGIYSLIQKDTELLGRLDEGYYRVTKVADGDTITVDMNGSDESVRFIGIDTPETHHPSKPVQCFGERAHSHLEELIRDNPVRLEADPTNSNRDRYDRLLRYVYLADGTLLNAKQIEDGYAFAYTAFPFEKLDEFRQLETTARTEERGLWKECEVNESDGYINTAPA